MKEICRSIWCSIGIALLAISSLTNPSETVLLPDATGGYSLVLAIDDVPDPGIENGIAFVDQIKASFEVFSIKLWEATKHQFYVKSLDIMVPSSWTIENTTDTTNQNFNTANVKISKTAERPYAENPNTCGKPGQFIELPFIFFTQFSEGLFGLDWKVLLNLWATYRWGVQEEHGYVGNLKYPYSYKNFSNNRWEVTGCSDQPIAGEFYNMHVQYTPSQLCSAKDTFNATSMCRFVPANSGQTAVTSLMHFHWLDSVTSFCDETNHNRLSPNRQNSHCDHKSVWEVMRETQDFKVVTDPTDVVPNVHFQVVKQSPDPILYILLDKGKVQGPLAVANQIPPRLISFLGDSRRLKTVVAVGSYPNPDGVSAVKEEIPWSRVDTNFDKFINVVGTLSLNGTLVRDFSQAILTAVQEIKAKNHQNGVAMLVIKYGADINNFEHYLPESDLVNALNEQGIVFNSIELGISNHDGHAHFAQLAKATGGLHTVISSYGAAQGAIGNVMSFLHKILNEHYVELVPNLRTLIKTTTTAGGTVRIQIPKVSSSQSQPGKVQVVFSTSDGTLLPASFVIRGISGSTGSVPISGASITKHQDWLESGSKWTYMIELLYEDKLEMFSEIVIQTICASCHGTMIVRTNIADNSKNTNVTISVYTNVDGSSVDMASNEPIIVFSKILKTGSPVTNARVTAIITNTNSNAITQIELADNGEGSPDEQSEDGIYSGYFVPQRDGNYRISIMVKENYLKTITNDEKSYNFYALTRSKSQARLLPIDQRDMSCNAAKCGVEMLPNEFVGTADLAFDIHVSGMDRFVPTPTKISTIFSSIEYETNTLNLMWLAPSVPGSLESVSSYDIRQSQSQLSLITDFENQLGLTTTIKPGTPGSLQMLKIPYPSSTTFYALRSEFRGKNSKISNVHIFDSNMDVVTGSPDPTPTTETSSSTRSSSSETSTGSTSLSDSTTIPTDSTTIPSDSTTVPTGPTTVPTGSTTTPSDSPPTDTTSPSTLSTTTEASTPWAKRPVGKAVISVIVIVAILVLALAGYLYIKKRKTAKGSINPPNDTNYRGAVPQ